MITDPQTAADAAERFPARAWTGRLNSRTGMQLSRRSFGFHFDPESTQRRIGRSVYVFRRVPGGIDVWRLAGLGSAEAGHHWMLEHAMRRTVSN